MSTQLQSLAHHTPGNRTPGATGENGARHERWHQPQRRSPRLPRSARHLGAGARRCLHARRPRRTARGGRPERLRQDHADGADLRPAGSRSGPRRVRAGGADAPARPAAALALARSTTPRSRCASPAAHASRPAAGRAELFAELGLQGSSGTAARALGRDAPARRVPTHFALGQARALPRRAVRSARRDHARGDAGVARPRAAARAAHGRTRHARRRGGGRARRPRRRALSRPGRCARRSKWTSPTPARAPIRR